MRVNEKTIKLARIRRYIRKAIKWHKVDMGFPEFYSSENYKISKRVKNKKHLIGYYPYYIKSERAIKEIAEKIYKEFDEFKVTTIRLDDQEMKALYLGASLNKFVDNNLLKIYHSNYKEKK